MKIQQNEKTVSFTVSDIQGLDPITVVLQDLAPGKGRLIVECWGTAWTTYWGAMGQDTTVRKFVLWADVDYIAARMKPNDRKTLKKDEAYLKRILKVVREALCSREVALNLSSEVHVQQTNEKFVEGA